MSRLFIIFLTVLFFSCRQKNTAEERDISRLYFVFNLKTTIGWKNFNDKIYEVPLVYYTDSFCYAVNPPSKFIRLFQAKLVSNTGAVNIYKTAKVIDDVSFHMAASMQMDDDTAAYNYLLPFMNCSSPELVVKTIPEITSTEAWSGMVMHEYFHGFQLRHPEFASYLFRHIVALPKDSLQQFYRSQAWFKESIDKENHLLLSALRSSNNRETNSLIHEFFNVRMKRRKETMQKFGLDIAPFEKAYETFEGTARYAEYTALKHFSTAVADKRIERSDTLFKSFAAYKNFELKQEDWLYLTEKSKYCYAIGFNLARLLDKLNSNYQERLFNEGALSLEQLLLEKTK